MNADLRAIERGKRLREKQVRILSKKVTSEDFRLSQLEYGNLVTSNPIKKRIFELDKNIHVGREIRLNKIIRDISIFHWLKKE